MIRESDRSEGSRREIEESDRTAGSNSRIEQRIKLDQAEGSSRGTNQRGIEQRYRAEVSSRGIGQRDLAEGSGRVIGERCGVRVCVCVLQSVANRVPWLIHARFI